LAQPLLCHLEEISSHLVPERPLCLLLDFDGTLAPIRKWPEKAQISGLTRSLLNRLSRLERLYVGILSGRALHDLYSKVKLPGLYYGGCHGLEMEGPGFSYQHPGGAKFRPLLSQIARKFKAQFRLIPGVMVEDKGLSVSLHHRNVKRGAIPCLRESFNRVLGEYSEWIEAIPGKEVLEARPKLDWNKGDAVLLLLDEARRKEGKHPSCFYLGDDQTDEDAFVALGKKGISVRVGREQPTAARYFLRNIKEVQEFLRWILIYFQL